MQNQSWQIFDEYLTSTRYAVRDPKDSSPCEKNYQAIINERIIPKLYTLKSSLIKSKKDLEDLAEALQDRLLIPATPFLMSFGNKHTRRPGYFSCYPLGWVNDSLDDIENMRRKMRTIYMAGGGAGIDLSKLRPKGSPVDSGQGIASGPVGFLPDFDAVTGTTNQGGRRRGALLVQLDWDHPDIIDYVKAKNFNSDLTKFIQTLPIEKRPAQSPHLSNMNISVNAFGDFWNQPELIHLIAENMWATGDPGLLFVDNMIQYSPLKEEEEPRFSNPCGEYLASAETACNLITVNAARIARKVYDKLIKKGYNPETSKDWSQKFSEKFWLKLAEISEQACFLGSLVLEFDEGYPLPEIKEKTQKLKPVGVGMSGFHSALLLAHWGEVVYGSPKAQKFAKTTQAFLTLGTLKASAKLAKETGHVYENRKYWPQHLQELKETIDNSVAKEKAEDDLNKLIKWVDEKGGFYNCLTTSQAPTGSVSVFLRNIDTGIEPFYSLELTRKVRDADKGWIEFTLEPVELADIFKKYPNLKTKAEAQTALKLSPMEQLGMLAAFQYHNHTGVSKTINLPSEVTVKEIEDLIIKSRDFRLKGFTVYRDNSLDGILSSGTTSKEITKKQISDIGGDREGGTFTATTANLTAHITLNHDEQKNIREVFVSAGDVGASINSIFTALGMIISVALRDVPNLFDRFVKVLSKVRMGERVIIHTKMSKIPIVADSLPHAIGRLMVVRKEYLLKNSEESLEKLPLEIGAYDLCPECYELSMRREGSCRKCDKCGYSTC